MNPQRNSNVLRSSATLGLTSVLLFLSKEYFPPPHLQEVTKRTASPKFVAPVVKQKGYGVCQTLAPMIDLAGYPEGLEHLHKLVTLQPNGDFNVKFPGYKKVQTVTQKDLRDSNLMKSTDPALTILGSAIIMIHLETGNVVDPFKLLMGEVQGQSYLVDLGYDGKLARDVANSKIAEILLKQAKANLAILVGHKFNNEKGRDIHKVQHDMPSSHAYALTVAANNNIIVKDPRDSSKEFEITQQEAGRVFNAIFAANTPTNAIKFPKYPKAMRTLQRYAAEASHANHLKQGSCGAFSIKGLAKPVDPTLEEEDFKARDKLRDALKQFRKELLIHEAELAKGRAKLVQFADSLVLEVAFDGAIAIAIREMGAISSLQTGESLSTAELSSIERVRRSLSHEQFNRLTPLFDMNKTASEFRESIKVISDAVGVNIKRYKGKKSAFEITARGQ